MSALILRRAAVAALLAFATVPMLAPSAHAHGTEVEVGTLTLTEGFSRATLPGAPVAGGFLAITNEGSEADRLIGVSSDAAGHMEIHETAMTDGVMTMRPLPDGLPLPAKETVMLKPGGNHIMFMDLKQPLVQGQTVAVTLEFEKAGKVTLPLAILAPDAKSFEAEH